MSKDLLLTFSANGGSFRVKIPNCWTNKKIDSKNKIIQRLFNNMGLDDSNPSFYENKDEEFDFLLDSNGFIKKASSPYYINNNYK